MSTGLNVSLKDIWSQSKGELYVATPSAPIVTPSAQLPVYDNEMV